MALNTRKMTMKKGRLSMTTQSFISAKSNHQWSHLMRMHSTTILCSSKRKQMNKRTISLATSARMRALALTSITVKKPKRFRNDDL